MRAEKRASLRLFAAVCGERGDPEGPGKDSRAILPPDSELGTGRVARRLTAAVARSIYEGEEKELALLRGAASFSPGLKKLEAELEDRRYELQAARIELRFEQKQQRPGLSFERARDVMWMFTSRDCYRMLVVEKQWSPDEYEKWLAELMVRELTKDGEQR